MYTRQKINVTFKTVIYEIGFKVKFVSKHSYCPPPPLEYFFEVPIPETQWLLFKFGTGIQTTLAYLLKATAFVRKRSVTVR
jgi:hypothetical protein